MKSCHVRSFYIQNCSFFLFLSFLFRSSFSFIFLFSSKKMKGVLLTVVVLLFLSFEGGVMGSTTMSYNITFYDDYYCGGNELRVLEVDFIFFFFFFLFISFLFFSFLFFSLLFFLSFFFLLFSPFNLSLPPYFYINFFFFSQNICYNTPTIARSNNFDTKETFYPGFMIDTHPTPPTFLLATSIISTSHCSSGVETPIEVGKCMGGDVNFYGRQYYSLLVVKNA